MKRTFDKRIQRPILSYSPLTLSLSLSSPFSPFSIVCEPRGLRLQDDLFSRMHPRWNDNLPLLLDCPGVYATGMARGVLTFLYLSWQDVVSFRVASVASITSNPSVVELSVDDPLSPIFGTPGNATSVLQSDLPLFDDGCCCSAAPPVATIQTNFQSGETKTRGERTDGEFFWGEGEKDPMIGNFSTRQRKRKKRTNWEDARIVCC